MNVLMPNAEPGVSNVPRHRQAPSRPDDEPPPRSLDDFTFQRDLDDLQDPLRNETFFGHTGFAWGVAVMTIAAVLVSLLLLIWFSYDAFLRLNQAFVAP